MELIHPEDLSRTRLLVKVLSSSNLHGFFPVLASSSSPRSDSDRVLQHLHASPSPLFLALLFPAPVVLPSSFSSFPFPLVSSSLHQLVSFESFPCPFSKLPPPPFFLSPLSQLSSFLARLQSRV